MKYSQSVTALILVMFLAIPMLSASAATFNGVEIRQGQWKGHSIEYLDREILVGLKSGKTQTEFSQQLGQSTTEVVRAADRFGFMKLRVAVGADLFKTIERISHLPAVLYAEPNMVVHLQLTPNDPMYNQQWHYNNIGQNPPGGTPDADIDCPEGWNLSTGDDTITVGVLDTGIPIQNGQLSHPDLNDPNRYFFGANMISPGNLPIDDNGHGTHVSGTIAAESNNGIGVAGVAWNVRIMSIKVFDASGNGTFEGFRDGCIYAVDHGCKVFNYSGGGPSPSSAAEHGIAYADSNDVVACVAAGNNWQGSVSYPGAYAVTYDNEICVSATDQNDQSSPFSSIGPQVTICAPGGHGSPFDADDIISTFPNYTCYLATTYGLPLNYSPLAGTSMATPHVAGLAALILSVDPSLTPDSVRRIIINTSEDLGPAGRDNQFGWGRINVYNALSQVRAVRITHTGLADTRDTVNAYEVPCQIMALHTLVTDSILLYYRVDSAAWGLDTLTSTGGPQQYHGYVPAQHPGKVVDYYLYAKDNEGNADTSAVYTFRVLDYLVALKPPTRTLSGAVTDTLWYDFRVTNTGIFTDNYALGTIGAGWPTTIWNAGASAQISSLGPLVRDDSADFKVRIIVPPSFYGDIDSLQVSAVSNAKPSVSALSTVVAFSEGAPLSMPFLENFATSSVDIGKWVKVVNADVNTTGTDEPSPPYSLNLDGYPSGADTIMSQAINLPGQTNVIVRYFFEQTGGGSAPGNGDDLYVEYQDSLGAWNLLQKHLGADPSMTSYQEVEITLPAGAYHRDFRLRLRNTAGIGNVDDWFVDDIFVGLPSDYSVAAAPSFQFKNQIAGDSAAYAFTIRNKGLYTDNYNLLDSNGQWPVIFFASGGTTPITATGAIAPTDSVTIIAKAAIPISAPIHAVDTSEIYAISQSDPGVATYAVVATTSMGVPSPLAWFEPVPGVSLDLSKWFVNVGSEVAPGLNPPSAPYILNLDGSRDTVVTQPLDLGGLSQAVLSYYWQRGGNGDLPESGDSLWVEFLNGSGNWVGLAAHGGGDTAMSQFAYMTLELPVAALYGRMQLRLRTNGGGAGQDDWFVDNLRVDRVPSEEITPASLSYALQQGDSIEGPLLVHNTGLGELTYFVKATQFLQNNAFARLLELGQVEPASHVYPAEYYAPADAKGAELERIGEPVQFNSGGPDNHGYYWMDSDQPGGPHYQWVDVSATGTDIVSQLTDDSYAGPFQLGFNFLYYGTVYHQIYIGSNGIVGFLPDSMRVYKETPLPSSSIPNAIMAMFWDDLDPTNTHNPGAHLYIDTTGGRCVIQYKNYPEFQGQAGDILNAEIILTSDGTIKYQYQSIAPGLDVLSCSIGTENQAGNDGLQVCYHAAYVHDQLAVQLYRPYEWLVPLAQSGQVPPGGVDTLPCLFRTAGLDEGTFQGELVISHNDPNKTPETVSVALDVSSEPPYLCGDANGDTKANVADAVFIINYVFVPGSPAPDPLASADVNCDTKANVADAVYLINYVFVPGSPAPCANCP